MNRCKPEKKDTERVCQIVENQSPKLDEGGLPDRKAKGGKLSERREEPQGRSARG